MTSLSARDLAIRRGGRRVLADVSLGFEAGQLTAIIGPNGAGKSSLLQALAGLIPPDAGAIELDGVPLASLPRRLLARRRAYLPQAPRVDWPITVERVVELGLAPAYPGFTAKASAAASQVERALALCDLLPLRSRPATSLSGGELARAMLARAIVGEPELLLADEPTAGLDPVHALDAMEFLRAHARRGHIVIVSLHDLTLAATYADRIVVLKNGRLLALGNTREVLVDEVLSNAFDLRVQVRSDETGLWVTFSPR